MEISGIDILTLLCWPAVALGVLTFFSLLRAKPRLARTPASLVAFTALAMVGVPPLLLFLMANDSAIMVANVEVLWIVVGAAALWAAERRRRGKAELKLAAGLALVGACALGVGAWDLIGDFLLPPNHVYGRISDMSYRFRLRGPSDYRVWIDGRRFDTTAEVYRRIHTGESVNAEVGAGSSTVLHATPL